mmetsp:Transcript_20323/g.50567  ORF Transcript_20323/g.50567 Transcript_20323/m.50567 type:complete len:201 (+) Transcript_20323:165-767(+)
MKCQPPSVRDSCAGAVTLHATVPSALNAVKKSLPAERIPTIAAAALSEEPGTSAPSEALRSSTSVAWKARMVSPDARTSESFRIHAVMVPGITSSSSMATFGFALGNVLISLATSAGAAPRPGGSSSASNVSDLPRSARRARPAMLLVLLSPWLSPPASTDHRTFRTAYPEPVADSVTEVVPPLCSQSNMTLTSSMVSDS